MSGSCPHAGGPKQYSAPAKQLQESRHDRPARFVKIDATDPVMVAKARAAIAKLYAKRGKTSPLQTFKNVRFSELEIVFAWCWRGTELPDDDAGREDLYTAACHLWHLGCKHGQDTAIKAWAAERAPWCGAHELSELISQVAATPLKFKADPLAHRLGLYMTNQLRTALGLTTIGDIDVGKKGREKLRAERQKAWKQQNRRNNGAAPRADYLANAASRTKPWDALGVSARTYYRRKARGTETETEVGTTPGTPKSKDILVLPDLSHSESQVTPWAAMGISRATWYRQRTAGKSKCGTMAVPDLNPTIPIPEPAAPTAPGRTVTWSEALEGEIVDRGVAHAPPPTHLERAVARARRLQMQGGAK
jgi:hypothetical protein